MGGIRPCELNKRLSGRLSSQMRELGPCRPPFAAYAARGRFCPEHGARSCRPPTTRWAAFVPVDRINAPLDGFHPERGNLSAPAAIRHPWRRLDGSGSDHGDHVRGGHVVPHPIRIFPKRKFYGQANHACITCNTYSVPYKGKSPKKRLSPKWVNTLIHQCVTFYVFLIFQYLSLWKSVFSSN